MEGRGGLGQNWEHEEVSRLKKELNALYDRKERMWQQRPRL